MILTPESALRIEDGETVLLPLSGKIWELKAKANPRLSMAEGGIRISLTTVGSDSQAYARLCSEYNRHYREQLGYDPVWAVPHPTEKYEDWVWHLRIPTKMSMVTSDPWPGETNLYYYTIPKSVYTHEELSTALEDCNFYIG
jgi:hypothetical protein